MAQKFFALVTTVCLVLTIGCKGLSKATVALPQDLLFQGKSVPDSFMKALVPMVGDYKTVNLDKQCIQYKRLDDKIIGIEIDEWDDSPEDKYEWRYIGTLPNGDHVVYGYWWPEGAMGKFTQIVAIRRINNELKVVSIIAGGGNRNATSIADNSWTLDGTELTYDQHVTTGILSEILQKAFPEYRQSMKHKNSNKLFWGEADLVGYVTMHVTIKYDLNNDSEPEELSSTLVAFSPSISFDLDQPEKERQKEYFDNWVKRTPKNSLDMGDALYDVSMLYAYKHRSNTLNLSQLKEVVAQVCEYAKDKA